MAILLDSNRTKPAFIRFSAALLLLSALAFPAGLVRILTLALLRCLLLGCLDDERVGYRSEINDLLRENAEDFERLLSK